MEVLTTGIRNQVGVQRNRLGLSIGRDRGSTVCLDVSSKAGEMKGTGA